MTRNRLITHTHDFHIYGLRGTDITPPSVFRSRTNGEETVAVELKGKETAESLVLYFVEGEDADGLAALDATITAMRRARNTLKGAVDDRTRAKARATD